MLIRDALSSSGIDSLDAELLLGTVLGKDRTWLFAHSDADLDDAHVRLYQKYVARRREGEPIAYIIGSQAFYGLNFAVDSTVLIPRPATERMVELALRALQGEEIPEQSDIDTHIVAWCRQKSSWKNVRLIADIGTGSGCIAVTIAMKRPDLHIIATDYFEAALNMARINAQNFHVNDRIELRPGSGLEPMHDVREPYVIISNPPYIAAGTPLDATVHDFEPHTALFAGPQGTDVLTQIIIAAMRDPHCLGWMMECEATQVPALQKAIVAL